MGIKEYYLYRAKFIKPSQLTLLAPDKSASELFLSAINDKPELRLNSGNDWHIGNIHLMDELSGVFAVGRTTKTTVEKFDEESGDFIDELDDSGPYTKVIFDCRIGLLGIAKKSKLAKDANVVASKIKNLFEKAKTVIDSGIEVRVDFIPDPENFIEKLKGAFAITKFKASFTGPNPVDADELFQKPLSVYAQEMGAEKGMLEVQGSSLNESTAEKIAKSTAATGNYATARIIEKEGGKSKPIKMGKGAVVVTVDEDSTPDDVLSHMREEYTRVRE